MNPAQKLAPGVRPAPVSRVTAAELAQRLRVRAAVLNARYRHTPAEELIALTITSCFRGRIAILSSFGAEAAVGLHMAAQADLNVPVLFLDTDRHFVPTLEYRDRLVKQIGLTNVRVLRPKDTEAHDPKGYLWRTDPDACCALRKVEPLAKVEPEYDAILTGRKRMHGGDRVSLPVFEAVGRQIRVSPFANWSAEETDAYMDRHGLPRHPLVEQGFRSIGCWPCTQPTADPADRRAGRWAGLEKTECGIHLPGLGR